MWFSYIPYAVIICKSRFWIELDIYAKRNLNDAGLKSITLKCNVLVLQITVFSFYYCYYYCIRANNKYITITINIIAQLLLHYFCNWWFILKNKTQVVLRLLKVSSDIEHLSDRNNLPAILNYLSTGANEAGMDKYLCANFAKVSNAVWCEF